MIVLDASAAIDLLLARPGGEAVARRIELEPGAILAPHLIDLEVCQVLRRFEALGVLGSERAELALADLEALGLLRHPHDALIPRIWELRRNATAYDAAYLALAEVTGAPLVTTDAKLAAIPGCRARVELMR